MTKKLLFSLMVCIALSSLFVGCKEETTKTKQTREYNAMILETATRKLSSTYSATIRGKQDVDIRTKVEGYITDIKVKEGASVRKDQTLFVIDQKQYQAALATAEAQVDAAQAKVDALDDDAKALLADYIANIAAAQASVDAYVPAPPKKSCGGVLTVGAVATMVLAGAWVAIAARKKED